MTGAVWYSPSPVACDAAAPDRIAGAHHRLARREGPVESGLDGGGLAGETLDDHPVEDLRARRRALVAHDRAHPRLYLDLDALARLGTRRRRSDVVVVARDGVHVDVPARPVELHRRRLVVTRPIRAPRALPGRRLVAADRGRGPEGAVEPGRHRDAEALGRASDRDAVAALGAGEQLCRIRDRRDDDAALRDVRAARGRHGLRVGDGQPLSVRSGRGGRRPEDARQRGGEPARARRQLDVLGARRGEGHRGDAVRVRPDLAGDATRAAGLERDRHVRECVAAGREDADRGRAPLTHLERRRHPELEPVRAVVTSCVTGDAGVDPLDGLVQRRRVDLTRARVAHQRVDVEHHRGGLVRAAASAVLPDGVGDPTLALERDGLAVAVSQHVGRVLAELVPGRRVPVAQVDAVRVDLVRDDAAVVAEPAEAVLVVGVVARAGRAARVPSAARARIVLVRRLARARVAQPRDDRDGGDERDGAAADAQHGPIMAQPTTRTR